MPPDLVDRQVKRRGQGTGLCTKSRYCPNMSYEREMKAQYLTCKFKLHNLSTHKRAVIDYVLKTYTLAYADMLDYAQEHEAELEARRLPLFAQFQ